MILPRTRGGRRSNGDAALLLLFHPVHGGPTLVHFTNFVRLARVVENALGRRGLARVNVRHDTNVAVEFEIDLALFGGTGLGNVETGVDGGAAGGLAAIE